MQRTLFLTSNLSGIWRHREFGKKRVSNKGHQCPHRSMIKCLTEASLVFALNFFPLVCNTKTGPTGRKTCHLHSTSLSRVQITTSLPCGKKFFLLDFVGPFFIYLYCLGGSYGRHAPPSLLEPTYFWCSPQGLSPSLRHVHSNQPIVCP